MKKKPKLTPAEQLAANKQRERPKRNYPAKSSVVLWTTKITEHREYLNLAMCDVAKAVGISISAYHRIEKGYSDVSLRNAISIARFFGVTVYELWPQWRGK